MPQWFLKKFKEKELGDFEKDNYYSWTGAMLSVRTVLQWNITMSQIKIMHGNLNFLECIL